MARILVACSEATMRVMFDLMAPGTGRQVAVVSDATLALYLLGKAEQFDLVISDYEMTGINGLELLRKIRADEQYAKVKCALISDCDTTPYGQSLTAICAAIDAKFVSKRTIVRIDQFIKQLLGG